MPTTPVYIPKWIQCTLHATQEGQERLTNFNFITSSTTVPSVGDLNSLAQSLYNVLVAAYIKPICGANVNFDFMEAKDRAREGGNVGIYTPPQPQAGTATGEALPGNVALVLSEKTNRIGRRYRGRLYSYGMVESQTAGSSALSSYIASWLSVGAILIGYLGIGPLPVKWVVASEKFLLLTEIFGVAVNAITDSQRRRLPDRGE